MTRMISRRQQLRIGEALVVGVAAAIAVSMLIWLYGHINPTYRPIILTQIGSALLRVIVVYVCARAYYLLGPECRNYRTPPWYVRPPIAAFGAISAGNVAELIDRAVKTIPPHPLLSGYGLSITEAVLAISLYGWLMASWRPESIQARNQARAESWTARIGAWPCVRRKAVIREQARKQQASEAVEAGALQADTLPSTDADEQLLSILRYH